MDQGDINYSCYNFDMLLYELTLANNEAAAYLQELGLHETGAKIIAEKLSRYVLRIDKLKGYTAGILKQDCLSVGAECALPYAAVRQIEESYSVIITGTSKQLHLLADKSAQQAFAELRELSVKLKYFLAQTGVNTFQFHKKQYPGPLLMGVLNVTPDSFSDGGSFLSPGSALAQVQKMIQEGAVIIDIGGESSRPGAAEISAEEEIRRVQPVLESIQKIPELVISIDTTKSPVARMAIKHGAQIINDISALQHDPQLAEIAAEAGVYLVLMHRSGPSAIMQQRTQYQELLPEVLSALEKSIQQATQSGVKSDKIILDPGIGFGKTVEQNLELLTQIKAFKSLGYPVMVGASRKSFIGKILDKEAPAEREIGTHALTVQACLAGADIIRVHDVATNYQALLMAAAINNRGGI